MWVKLLVPILAKLLAQWLKDQSGGQPKMGDTPPMSKKEADALANDLQAVLDRQVKSAGEMKASTEVGGMIQLVNDIIAALRAKDWIALGPLVKDFLSRL